MATAVIVDAVRTPGASATGSSRAGTRPTSPPRCSRPSPSATTSIPPSIDDVIMGCVMQVGSQGLNIGRNAVLAAGLPESVPGHHGRPPVRLVAAVGPLRRPGRDRRRLRHRRRRRRRGHDHHARWAPRSRRAASRSGPKVIERYAEVGGLVPQGISAELIADKWGLSPARTSTPSAPSSQQRAAQATEEGRFEQRDHPGPGQAARQGERQAHRDRRDRHGRRGHPARHHRRDAGQAQAGVQARRRWSPPATARRSPTAPRPC